ncbi:YdeI/OmpD-associated family protein [Paenisporosarcina quisquiliarum]|uniref:YdeI/OmpD-associated family protein n=1 Tax=Paenisporosarcina quisquiliarum TaxID=365346 RepID=UPI0037355841
MNSERSIVDKLRIKKFSTKLLLAAPEDISDFNSVNMDTEINKEQYQFVFIFIHTIEEFLSYLKTLIEKDLVQENGFVYFAYPKKNNPKYEHYIERDRIFDYIDPKKEGFVQDSNLKFSKMVSLNDVYTIIGLKSMKKDMQKPTSQKNSQCVDDYIDFVDTIKIQLTNNEDLLNAYNHLTFGYQKDWARYIYSAKRKETQEKRFEEMGIVLGEGYKSMDLYRKKKK